MSSSARLTLWLRCGVDGVRPCGDPSSHYLFMLLLLKAKTDPRLKFDVRTLNESKPPPEFRETGARRAPALQVSEETAFSHEDDILEEIDCYEPTKCSDEDAENAIADLFRSFAFYIKDVKDSKGLSTELYRLDEYLSANEHKFLSGDEVTSLDCLLLPRLHSIRIAAKALKDYDFPSDLTHVKRYLNNGYQLDMFRTSCPCDQEIILHWIDRPGTTPICSAKRSQISRQEPKYSFSI
ncbi:unnamed protein product [Auanema sp. JU1783]|nr:unnamed protein product [Auanema sp. JU1783]